MHGVQIGHGSNGVANLEWRLPLDSGYSRRTGSTPKQVHLVKRNTNRIIATSATCVALFVRTNLRFYVLLGDLSASIFRSCSRAFARLCSVLDLGLTTLQQARKNTASLSRDGCSWVDCLVPTIHRSTSATHFRYTTNPNQSSSMVHLVSEMMSFRSRSCLSTVLSSR